MREKKEATKETAGRATSALRTRSPEASLDGPGETAPRMTVPRERDGKYAPRNFKRACACGHALGLHTAEMPRECIAGDFDSTVSCDCEGFKKTRGTT